MIRFASTVIWILSCNIVVADIAFDSFDYVPSNPLVQQGMTGNGFTGAWKIGAFNAVSSALNVDAGSLIHASVAASGNSVSTLSQNALSGLVRDLSVPIGVSDQTVYLSFVAHPLSTYGTGIFNSFFGVTLESPTEPELFVGRGGSADFWSIESRGGNARFDSTVVPVLRENTLLVLRAQLFSSALTQDNFALYINPTGNSEPQNADASGSFIMGTVTGVGIYYTGGFAIDEIRIGSSFASVTSVPEPRSIALIAIGGFVLAWKCFRRRSRCLTVTQWLKFV